MYLYIVSPVCQHQLPATTSRPGPRHLARLYITKACRCLAGLCRREPGSSVQTGAFSHNIVFCSPPRCSPSVPYTCGGRHNKATGPREGPSDWPKLGAKGEDDAGQIPAAFVSPVWVVCMHGRYITRDMTAGITTIPDIADSACLFRHHRSPTSSGSRPYARL